MRVVPEAMKPRAIPITTAKKVVLEAARPKSPRDSLTIEFWERPTKHHGAGGERGLASTAWSASECIVICPSLNAGRRLRLTRRPPN